MIHKVREEVEFYEWRGERIMLTLDQEVLKVEEVGDTLVMLSHEYCPEGYVLETFWIKDNILYNSPYFYFHETEAWEDFNKITSPRNLTCHEGQFLLVFPE